MRAARLIRMVLLLQSRPAMTAAELAEELGVCERTVTRDAQALCEAGIPVYSDRGRTGGYRLVGGYRTRLTGLARGEAEALFLSGVPSALRDMGLEDAASAARLKVSAALLPSLQGASRTAAQRFHLDAPGWFKEPETPGLLPAVADAVWAERRITARYRRRTGPDGRDARDGQEGQEGQGGQNAREVSRTLEPYGLVLKAGVWYLCARVVPDRSHEPGAAPNSGSFEASGAVAAPDAGRPRNPAPVPTPARDPDTGQVGDADRTPDAGSPAAFRVYRIDRFSAVTPAPRTALEDGRFVRDETFDLPAFWAEQAARFARAILRETVVLRLSAAGVRLLVHAVDPVGAREALARAAEADVEGWVTVTLPVESEDVAYTQLLALGPEAEVLKPATLRRRLAEAAERTAARYR